MQAPTDTEILDWITSNMETDMDGLIIFRSSIMEEGEKTGECIVLQKMLAGEPTKRHLDGPTLREAVAKAMSIERKSS